MSSSQHIAGENGRSGEIIARIQSTKKRLMDLPLLVGEVRRIPKIDLHTADLQALITHLQGLESKIQTWESRSQTQPLSNTDSHVTLKIDRRNCIEMKSMARTHPFVADGLRTTFGPELTDQQQTEILGPIVSKFNQLRQYVLSHTEHPEFKIMKEILTDLRGWLTFPPNQSNNHRYHSTEEITASDIITSKLKYCLQYFGTFGVQKSKLHIFSDLYPEYFPEEDERSFPLLSAYPSDEEISPPSNYPPSGYFSEKRTKPSPKPIRLAITGSWRVGLKFSIPRSDIRFFLSIKEENTLEGCLRQLAEAIHQAYVKVSAVPTFSRGVS